MMKLECLIILTAVYCAFSADQGNNSTKTDIQDAGESCNCSSLNSELQDLQGRVDTTARKNEDLTKTLNTLKELQTTPSNCSKKLLVEIHENELLYNEVQKLNKEIGKIKNETKKLQQQLDEIRKIKNETETSLNQLNETEDSTKKKEEIEEKKNIKSTKSSETEDSTTKKGEIEEQKKNIKSTKSSEIEKKNTEKVTSLQHLNESKNSISFTFYAITIAVAIFFLITGLYYRKEIIGYVKNLRSEHKVKRPRKAKYNQMKASGQEDVEGVMGLKERVDNYVY